MNIATRHISIAAMLMCVGTACSLPASSELEGRAAQGLKQGGPSGLGARFAEMRARSRYYGGVSVNQLNIPSPDTGTASPVWNATAEFWKGARCDDNRRVMPVDGGKCEIFAPCPSEELSSRVPTQAGTVHIRGTSTPIDLLPGSLNPSPPYYYGAIQSGTGAAFFAGQGITFAAEGSADVRAFEAHAFAPALTPLSAPEWAGGTGILDGRPGTIDRTQGLALTWTPPTAPRQQDAKLLFFVAPSDPTADYAICSFPSLNGHGFVPPQALQTLPAGPGSYLTSNFAEYRHGWSGHADIRGRLQFDGPQGELTLN